MIRQPSQHVVGKSPIYEVGEIVPFFVYHVVHLVGLDDTPLSIC